MAKKSSTVQKVFENMARRQTVTAKIQSLRLKAEAECQLKSQDQKAFYEMVDAASAVRDRQSFYKKLHQVARKLMYAGNFFIAIYDEQTGIVNWPYYADEADIDPSGWESAPLNDFQGSSRYIFRTGKTIAVEVFSVSAG
jgi:hypothetical protein